jgi:hypothetical protein
MVHRIAALVLLFKLALMPANAAETLTGSWSIQPQSRPERVDFLVRIEDNDRHSTDETSTDFDLAELGLNDASLRTDGSKITIALARDGGSIAGSGIVTHGTASGSFVFTPSAAYRTAMRERGYPGLSARDQLRATMENISLAFVDEIASAGYRQLPFDELLAFRGLRIDGAYIAAARATFPSSTLDANLLVQLAALRVTQAFVTEFRAEGFAVERPADAVQLRAMNIDRGFVHDLAAAGFAHLSLGELIQLRALGIDGTYIKRVESHGIARPTVDQLMRLRAMNIVRSAPVAVTS